jgi:hypothetical protein
LAALELGTLRATIRGHIVYAIVIAASVLVTFKRLAALLIYAWKHDSSSQILLIPIIALYFDLVGKKTNFRSH